MNHRRESKRTLLLKGGAVFFGVILLLSTIMFGVSWWEQSQQDDQETSHSLREQITYNGQTYALRDGLTTLLVMGLDSFDNESSEAYRNDKQADFLALLVMDNRAKSCKVIQINRDTMVEMNVLGVTGEKVDTKTAQIAQAHTYGDGRQSSCRNTADAVKNLLGVDIMYYVSVSMDAVPTYNDMLGGVSVEIMDDFTSIDPTMVQGTTLTLTGEQALTYVRARKGLDDPTNQHRMQRQKQYLRSMMEQTKQKINEDAAFALTSINEMSAYWVSNRTAESLADMIQHYNVSDPEAYHTIEGTSKVGEKYMEFIPDKKSIKEIVIDCFYEEVN